MPVALNSGLFWPRRSLRMHPGTITVEFLPPIPPGLKRQQFMSELESSIEGVAEQLYNEALQQFFPDKSMPQEEPAQGCG